jgi:hypothetical protein
VASTPAGGVREGVSDRKFALTDADLERLAKLAWVAHVRAQGAKHEPLARRFWHHIA